MLTFEQVLVAIKQNRRVRRLRWSPDLFVRSAPLSIAEEAAERPSSRALFLSRADVSDGLRVAAPDSLAFYVPTNDDLFAEDWVVDGEETAPLARQASRDGTRDLHLPRIEAQIAFAREAFPNDGAEGETVHSLCDAVERLLTQTVELERLSRNLAEVAGIQLTDEREGNQDER